MGTTRAANPQPISLEKALPTLNLEQLFTSASKPKSYLVDGLLGQKSLSLVTAKPKVGKSHLARQLAASVALGRPFLGRAVTQGAVLYITFAGEDSDTDVARHFFDLGLSKSDPIEIYFGDSLAVKEPAQAIARVQETIDRIANLKLVCVDTLFKLLRVGDTNDYRPVNDAMALLSALAVRSGVHICAVHHDKKKGGEDSGDNILGSSAIYSNVDTVISLKCNAAGVRSLRTENSRVGNFPETQLVWNSDSRSVSLGNTVEEIREAETASTEQRIDDDLLAYVLAHPRCERQSALNAVFGAAGTKSRRWQSLVDSKLLTRSGQGRKGDPYLYSVADVQYEQVAA